MMRSALVLVTLTAVLALSVSMGENGGAKIDHSAAV